MNSNQVIMEISEKSKWDVRPRDEGWTEYRVKEAAYLPDQEESFLPWPNNEDGGMEFVALDDGAIMELRHEDGRLAVYVRKQSGFRVQYEAMPKRNLILHMIKITGLPFKIDRRRMWLENRAGFRYFLGCIKEGETVYVTEDAGQYTLKMDEVCQRLVSRPLSGKKDDTYEK